MNSTHAPGQTRRAVNDWNHTHHTHHTVVSALLCALLVAPLRGTQVVAIVMCDHDGAVSRSSARRRRERRLRAALRHEQLSIAMHLAQALHHSSGQRKHVDVVGSGEAFGPVLVSGLLEPSSGSVGPFKHLHVAAQSPVAGAAPLLGDDFWDQPLSLEKLKDLLPSPVSVPVTVPVVAASVPSSVTVQQRNVEESGDVSWPQDRWEWYRARSSVPPCPDLSRFSQPAVCSSIFAGPSVSVSSSLPRQSSAAARFGTSGFRPMKVCLHLYNGVCFQGEQCPFAHSSLELHPNADFSQLELAWELDGDASDESGA